MTRKRKNVEETQQQQQQKSAPQTSQTEAEIPGYGYGNYAPTNGRKFESQEAAYEKFAQDSPGTGAAPRFGSGTGHGDRWKKSQKWSGDGDQPHHNECVKLGDLKKWKSDGGDVNAAGEHRAKEEGGRGDFPKEIVSYLRRIEQLKSEQTLDDWLLQTCAKEVAGFETTLLEYTESCVVVENVFGSSAKGAEYFLSALAKLKHKKLLDVIFSGSGARTVEKLLYAMSPVELAEQVQLVEKFAELLCDNWNDVVVDQPAGFLLRCIIRVSSGLNGPRQADKKMAGKRPTGPAANEKGDVEKPKFASGERKSELKRIHDKIALLAFDPSLNLSAEHNLVTSLVLQEAFNADGLWKAARVDDYIRKIVGGDHFGDRITSLWSGKHSSQLWQQAVASCSEDSRTSLWMAGVGGRVAELAADLFANYPLQQLIASVVSLELATDVVDETADLLGGWMETSRDGVVRAVLTCAGRHDVLQETVLKRLRTHFHASKAANKTHFLANLLTGNHGSGEKFDVDSCTLQGSLLLEQLLKFNKVKTISTCLEALSVQKIREMAKHRVACHTLQNVLGSRTIGDDVKTKIVVALESDWADIINDKCGSFVFEKAWDWYSIGKKKDVMRTLISLRSNTPSFKFALFRCDSKQFQKDQKAWIQRWKKPSE